MAEPVTVADAIAGSWAILTLAERVIAFMRDECQAVVDSQRDMTVERAQQLVTKCNQILDDARGVRETAELFLNGGSDENS
jgi:hypothetical protein